MHRSGLIERCPAQCAIADPQINLPQTLQGFTTGAVSHQRRCVNVPCA